MDIWILYPISDVLIFGGTNFMNATSTNWWYTYYLPL
jgi:hypothetical protein